MGLEPKRLCAHLWTRQLSTLFGVHPDVALAALRDLVDAGAVESRIANGGHEYRLTPVD